MDLSSKTFGALAEQYNTIIDNIVNSFKFLTNGVVSVEDLRQEALMALYRASVSSLGIARPYIIKCIWNAVWNTVNKYKNLVVGTSNLDTIIGDNHIDYSSLELDALSPKTRHLIQMILNGQSEKDILCTLNIKKMTYNKLLLKAKKQLLEYSK